MEPASTRKQRYLYHLARTGSTEKAREAVGVAASTVERWRSEDDEFRAAYSNLVASAAGNRPRERPRGSVEDFIAFRRHYFGMETYYHQRLIVEAIWSLPPQGKVMVLVPPEHGKTTLVEDLCCYILAHDPNHRITVVSGAAGHARKMLRRVKSRMWTGEDAEPTPYQADFGPFYVPMQERLGKPWSQNHIVVFKADHDERDYSLEARAWRSIIQGTRVDTLIVDDIQAYNTSNQTEEMLATFRQDMLTRVGRHGRVVIVGTRVGEGDFYDRLISDGVVDNLVAAPATDVAHVVECDCDLGIQHERPLCPELWDSHSLAVRRRDVGETVWWTTYQQRPRHIQRATFDLPVVEAAKDHARRVEATHTGEHPVIVSVDPALGGGNAVLAVACHPDRMELLDLAVDWSLSATEEILAIVETFAARYRPAVVIVEADTQQKHIVNDTRMHDLARSYGFSVASHLTRGEKADPVLGVAAMASAFFRRQVSIPWGDEWSRKRFMPLVEQLLAWKPGARHLVQDAVMALWFAWRWWTRHTTADKRITSWRREKVPAGWTHYEPITA